MSFSRACFSKDSEVQSIFNYPSKTAFVDLTYLVCICCRRSRSALLETFWDLYIKTMTTSGLCCTLETVASTSLVSIQGPNVKLWIRNIASARRLSLVNICVRFLRNPSRVSQELQSGREIANGQTDGHRGDNIIRPLRSYNSLYSWLNLIEI